jgi:hypothetical protein
MTEPTVRQLIEQRNESFQVNVIGTTPYSKIRNVPDLMKMVEMAFIEYYPGLRFNFEFEFAQDDNIEDIKTPLITYNFDEKVANLSSQNGSNVYKENFPRHRENVSNEASDYMILQRHSQFIESDLKITVYGSDIKEVVDFRDKIHEVMFVFYGIFQKNGCRMIQWLGNTTIEPLTNKAMRAKVHTNLYKSVSVYKIQLEKNWLINIGTINSISASLINIDREEFYSKTAEELTIDYRDSVAAMRVQSEISIISEEPYQQEEER